MKTLLRLWVLLTLLVTVVQAHAYDFEVDGICYDITSFTDLTVCASSIKEDVYGELIIPIEVTFNDRVLKVTQLSNNFVSGNNNITKVTSLANLYTIGDAAFKDCTQLREIRISSCQIIGDCVFQNNEMLEDLILPQNLIEIGNYAFQNCKSLKYVDLPTNITTIGKYAFSYNSSLAGINIPNISQISEGLFMQCESLTSIILPETVTNINDFAFMGCRKLSDIELCENLHSIGKSAFSNCESFSVFHIPNSVTSVGEDCLKGTILEEVYIGAGIKELPGATIFGCDTITTLKICKGDEAIEIGSNGCVIYEGPSGGRYPDSYAYGAFKNLKLTRLIVERPLIYTYKTYREIYTPGPGMGSGESSVYYKTPFEDNIFLKEIIVSDNFVMTGNRGYKQTTLSDRYYGFVMKELCIFSTCTNLTTFINKSEQNTKIPQNAFNGCTNLTSIELGNITTIESDAFVGCLSLKSIELPSSIKNINNSLVDINLSTIIINATTPPTSRDFSNNSYLNCKLLIPYGTNSIYSQSSPWNNFWNIEEMPEIFATDIILI